MEQQANRAEELAAQYQAGSRQAMEDLIPEIQYMVYYIEFSSSGHQY